MERELRDLLPGRTFRNVPAVRSRTMRAVKGVNNRTTERRLRAALVAAGIRGWRVRPLSTPGNPDFFFSRAKLAIFVDGCFWHGCRSCYRTPKTNSAFWKAKIARNRAKDLRTTDALIGTGVRVLRFWEHELRNGLPACMSRIKDDLRKMPAHRSKRRAYPQHIAEQVK